MAVDHFPTKDNNIEFWVRAAVYCWILESPFPLREYKCLLRYHDDRRVPVPYGNTNEKIIICTGTLLLFMIRLSFQSMQVYVKPRLIINFSFCKRAFAIFFSKFFERLSEVLKNYFEISFGPKTSREKI